MENKLCQSCGMPLNADEHFGKNADGTRNDEYCIYCYDKGAFQQDVTMDEMIEHCVEYLDEFNKDSEVKYSREEAIAQMKQFFPMLKRWQKN